jgi:hypothetical protein
MRAFVIITAGFLALALALPRAHQYVIQPTKSTSPVNVPDK